MEGELFDEKGDRYVQGGDLHRDSGSPHAISQNVTSHNEPDQNIADLKEEAYRGLVYRGVTFENQCQ